MRFLKVPLLCIKDRYTKGCGKGQKFPVTFPFPGKTWQAESWKKYFLFGDPKFLYLNILHYLTRKIGTWQRNVPTVNEIFRMNVGLL